MKYGFLLIIPACLFIINSKKIINNNSIIDNTNTQEDTGRINLFDGKTFSGWHTYGKFFVTSAWKIDNGTIHLDASKLDEEDNTINGGDLITDDVYSNFDLKYEWKISKGGNSGVKFFVQEDTTKYDEAIGLEMQVIDNVNHEDGKHATHRAGSLYDLIAPSADVAKPYNEWNDAEIICDNGILKFYLNGTKIVETTLWNDNWKKMVGHSKYKHIKEWGTFKTGHIALQDHGADVWFRNISIKKL